MDPFILIVAVLTVIILIAFTIIYILYCYLERAKKRKKAERQKQIAEEKAQQEEERRKRYKEFLANKQAEFKATVDSIPLFEITLSDEKHTRNQEIDIVDKEYKNITKTTPVKKVKDFVAVDVETTGLKTGGNDIIQLSAIKYKNFQAVEAFDAYLKPRKSIPQEATDINGITDEMVADAPRFYQIINCFNTFIEELPLVTHNAPFDIKHLYVNGLDSVQDKTVYDTLELSRKTYKDEYSYKLADICEINNIYMCNAHDALYDSFAAGELFKRIVADIKEIDIDDLFSTE